MKYYFTHFIIAFILLLNSIRVVAQYNNETADFFNYNRTFAITMNPNCEIQQYVLAMEELCKDNHYTIHGLWPDPESSCTSCTEEQFNENNLSEVTLKYMNMLWPSCKNGSDNQHFWRHEWSKHGTCSGMSQEEFFSTAISLYKEYIHLCHQGHKICQICFTPTLQIEGLCPVTNDI